MYERQALASCSAMTTDTQFTSSITSNTNNKQNKLTRDVPAVTLANCPIDRHRASLRRKQTNKQTKYMHARKNRSSSKQESKERTNYRTRDQARSCLRAAGSDLAARRRRSDLATARTAASPQRRRRSSSTISYTTTKRCSDTFSKMVTNAMLGAKSACVKKIVLSSDECRYCGVPRSKRLCCRSALAVARSDTFHLNVMLDSIGFVGAERKKSVGTQKKHTSITGSQRKTHGGCRGGGGGERGASDVEAQIVGPEQRNRPPQPRRSLHHLASRGEWGCVGWSLAMRRIMRSTVHKHNTYLHMRGPHAADGHRRLVVDAELHEFVLHLIQSFVTSGYVKLMFLSLAL